MDANQRYDIKQAVKTAVVENPVAAVTAGALVIGALAKLIDAVSSAKGRRAYAKQVNYRVRHRK